jgi:hypothetical protein
MRKVFLLSALFFVQSVSAETVKPLTIIDQRGYIPSGLFMFIMAVALVSLVASYRWNDEMTGFISIMASFAAMWTSRAVDYVTGVAVNSSADITVVHTIYHPDILTVITGICFVLSLLNVYRIYLLAKQDGQR